MTFVEVLVVLAIIGVLLALLLPALARARASGRKVDCAARMREMGRAFNLYANDNRGFVPRDHTPDVMSGGRRGSCCWVPTS